MAHWQDYSSINSDVVFFRYIAEGVEKHCDQVFVWDLDKTYLDTSWGGPSDLFRLILERSISKKNIPGTSTLIRALIDSWALSKGNRHFPLYFITASPPQMESRISEKFSFDGITPFGCFYKDNLQNLRPKRFWRLNKQVGFKVQSLMQLRLQLKEDIKMFLWGDDSESDAVIYNLFSDICSRRLGAHDLRMVLGHFAVTGDQVDTILNLQAQVPENDPVRKIYINLATDTDPDYYLKFGRRTLPTYNTFQTALDLYQAGRVDFSMLLKVIHDMIENYQYTVDELTRSFDDLVRRQVLGVDEVGELVPRLQQEKLMTRDYQPSIQPIKLSWNEERVTFESDETHEPWVPEHIEYLNDYR